MIPYGNKSGKGNVTHYKLGDNFIIVQFDRGRKCQYSEPDENPKWLIDEMKELAKGDEGLTGCIVKNKPIEDWRKEP